MTAPVVPICRSAEDPEAACRFASRCHETRQRIAHYATPPLRGMACWAFQQLSDRHVTGTPVDEAALERAAIQEGA